MNTSQRAVILFSQSPLKETVRKSTFNKLNQEKLFDIFLQKIFCTINYTRRKTEFDFILSSDSPSKIFFEYSKKNKIIFLQQNGEDFSKRFEATIRETFEKGYEEVIILGNDCLDLTADILFDSFKKMESNDFVIGPAVDGGFYLLGLKRFESKIYNHIDWLTDKVFDQLVSNIEADNNSYGLLPELSDIDNSKDLYKWLKQCTSIFCTAYYQIISIITEVVQNQFDNISFILESIFTESFWNRPPPVVCR